MTEPEAVIWAAERRDKLRAAVDEISKRVGAEGYMDDVGELDEIMRRHGFHIVQVNPLDGTRLWDNS